MQTPRGKRSKTAKEAEEKQRKSKEANRSDPGTSVVRQIAKTLEKVRCARITSGSLIRRKKQVYTATATLVTRTEEMTQKIGRPIQQVAHWTPMDATSATTDSGRQDTGLFPNHMHLPASRTP